MNQIERITDQSWKTKALIAGAVVGAAIGAGTAYLLSRAAEETHGGPPKINTADAVKAAIGVVGVMRGIASLGDR
jgi:hypothetical protein